MRDMAVSNGQKISAWRPGLNKVEAEQVHIHGYFCRVLLFSSSYNCA